MLISDKIYTKQLRKSHQQSLLNNNNPDQQKQSNIQVSLRIRPLLLHEDQQRSDSMQVLNDKQLQYEVKEEFSTYLQTFEFDRIYNITEQQVVFDGQLKELLDQTFQGKNCTFFVYGAMNSGKTHTIIGNQYEPGLAFKLVDYLFSLIQKKGKTIKLKMSIIEVFNEQVRDLINSSQQNLELREDPGKGFVVQGVQEEYILTSSQAYDILFKGDINRAVETTDFNANSSRSHLIIQTTIETVNQSIANIGKLNLVDLASKSNNNFQNKSILSLQNCIMQLNNQQKNKSSYQHIPYRDSKLTRILKDSLNGNFETQMLATISPIQSKENLQTLNFSQLVRNVKIPQLQKQVAVQMSQQNYDLVISDLKNQLNNLKGHMEQMKHKEENQMDKVVKDIQVQFLKEQNIKEQIENQEKKIINEIDQYLATKNDFQFISQYKNQDQTKFESTKNWLIQQVEVIQQMQIEKEKIKQNLQQQIEQRKNVQMAIQNLKSHQQEQAQQIFRLYQLKAEQYNLLKKEQNYMQKINYMNQYEDNMLEQIRLREITISKIMKHFSKHHLRLPLDCEKVRDQLLDLKQLRSTRDSNVIGYFENQLQKKYQIDQSSINCKRETDKFPLIMKSHENLSLSSKRNAESRSTELQSMKSDTIIKANTEISSSNVPKVKVKKIPKIKRQMFKD